MEGGGVSVLRMGNEEVAKMQAPASPLQPQGKYYVYTGPGGEKNVRQFISSAPFCVVRLCVRVGGVGQDIQINQQLNNQYLCKHNYQNMVN